MDTLTKIFVVVLVVLILLACPVIINVIVTHENYREQRDQERQRSAVMELTARTAMTGQEAAISERDRYRSDLEEARGNFERRVAELESSYSDERLARADLQQSYNTVSAQLSGLNRSLESSIDMRRELSEQLETARTTANQLRQERAELADSLRDSEARTDRMSGQIRLLREQLAASQQRVSELEDRLARIDPDEMREPPVARPDLDITAEVTAVDENIVGINIGSAQGVQEDMQMIIYRDAELVAQFRIQEVDAGSAAGIITTRLLDPRPGDKVTTTMD